MKQLDAPPIRGDKHLDAVVMSFREEVTDTKTQLPLVSATDVDSDHRVVVIQCKLKHRHSFKWINYTTKEVTDFNKKMQDFDWLEMANTHQSASDLVMAAQAKYEEFDRLCFPRQK